MDHTYIDELDLIERYLMGRLGADETAQFEEHFVDCSQCVDRLNTTKALIEGLRLVASDPMPKAATMGRKSLFGYLQNPASRPSLALASVALLIVLLGTAVVSHQIWRSGIRASQAQNASAEWERRYEEEQQSHSLADSKHQASERELTSQVAQLQAELENQRKQELARAISQQAALEQPQINFATFELTSARGSNPESGAINKLTLPRTPTRFMISIALEGETGYQDYRITIKRGQNQIVWKRRGFKPNQYDAISAGFNSSLFRDGDYVLVLEGVSANGSRSVVGEYSLHVLKTS